ncbi:MAG: hypothetical protein H6Q70_3157 [Firmicutes bacterium]|nr:hypothetical protein [Bacillota bacterium]
MLILSTYPKKRIQIGIITIITTTDYGGTSGKEITSEFIINKGSIEILYYPYKLLCLFCLLLKFSFTSCY